MLTKKEITITGSAVSPITVGEVKFETQNTLYTLCKQKSSPIAGMMIKKMFEMRGC